MFLFGVAVAFVFEGPQRGDDQLAGLGGLDDAIEITALRSNERIGEAAAKFSDFLLAQPCTLAYRCGVQFALVDDVHGPFRPHHGNFGAGPSIIRVGADVL